MRRRRLRRRDEAGFAVIQALVAGAITAAAFVVGMTIAVGQKIAEDDAKELVLKKEAAVRERASQHAAAASQLEEIMIGPIDRDPEVAACQRRIALDRLGLTWNDKGGWRLPSDPQPRFGTDATVYAAQRDAWVERMHGYVGKVHNDWLVECKKSAAPSSDDGEPVMSPTIPGEYDFQFGGGTCAGAPPDMAITIRYRDPAIQLLLPPDPTGRREAATGTVEQPNLDFTAVLNSTSEVNFLPNQVNPSVITIKLTFRGTFEVFNRRTIIRGGSLQGRNDSDGKNCSFSYGATRRDG
jgi:hypothetical protein